jgi:hypothetical protein
MIPAPGHPALSGYKRLFGAPPMRDVGRLREAELREAELRQTVA